MDRPLGKLETARPTPDSALRALFAPTSVAIVGASSRPEKLTSLPLRYLQRSGFSGTIWPVNTQAERISSLQCYPSVAALPGGPDIALVMLGGGPLEDAVGQLAARGTKLAIIMSHGAAGEFAGDSDDRSHLLNAAGEMRLLGPNSIGAIDANGGVAITASGSLESADIHPGGISLVSQSGGVMGAFLSKAAAHGVGLAKLVATGNEIDLDSADVIEFLASDAQTRVIAIYTEAIRAPRRFRAATVSARAQGKPVVILKVGRSETGMRAAISHTGAVAGEDMVCDAFLRQCGVIRAETLGNLLDISTMLTAPRQIRGNRVAVLTSTGGAGGLLADEFGARGLDLPLHDPVTGDRLAALLKTPMSATANPTDVTLEGVQPETIRKATETLLHSEGIDGVVVVVGSSALINPGAAIDAIHVGAGNGTKPVLAYVSPHAPQIARALNVRGVPTFTSAEACAIVLKASLLASIDTGAEAAAGPAVQPPSDVRRGALNEPDAAQLMSHYGLKSAEHRLVQTEAEARLAAEDLGGRVVLKVVSSSLMHKAEVGGVMLDLSVETIERGLLEMRDALALQGILNPEGFLVQKQVLGGVEMLLGFRRDPHFGPVLVLSAGGALTNLLDEWSIRCLPLRRDDARDMVNRLRISRALSAGRPERSYDVEALVEAIGRFARMAESLGDRLVEAEVNPLIVMPTGQGVIAVDGLAVIA